MGREISQAGIVWRVIIRPVNLTCPTLPRYPHIPVRTATSTEQSRLLPGFHNHNRTGNVSVTASCADCHNKTSNLFRYSANASAAHYGRNASFGLSPGESYCAYCHENSSTVYRDVMQNQNNNILEEPYIRHNQSRPSRRAPRLHDLPLD